MRIRILHIITLMLFGICSYGQNFDVSQQLQFSGRIGEEIEGTIVITNTSSEVINLGILRLESTIGTGQKSRFCVNNECQEDEVEGVPLRIQIGPGQSFDGFKSILTAGLGEGYSVIKYLIYDRNNTGHEVEVEVNYTVTDQQTKKHLFSSKEFILNDVYPNPVSEFAIVDYAILNPETEAKIVIHSVLGSVIGEYKLQPLETNLTIKANTFNPGVYFYTLYIENDGVMTRKLIVRK